MNWSAIWLSLRLAAIVCLILLVVGVPVAYWIAFSRRRWKFLVEAGVALPLVLPPTVLGYYMLLALGPRSPLGRIAESLFSARLAFSFPGLVIASVLYSFPFAVQPMVNAFESVDRRLLDAAAVLGASRSRIFRTIILPIAKAGVITGAVLSFAHTIGEFGVVLMVGGNIPGVTQTISIAIYDEVQTLDYALAARTSVLLLIFSFATLAFVYALNRRNSIWWSGPRNA
ncbi:MAG TPA: molybdate ABC transporter permease subunit [Terriglobales bacterium]|nr:molybdate ABC transporter permease subunit [Terriglobales bacterium]